MSTHGRAAVREGGTSGLLVSGWTELAAVLMISGGLLAITEAVSALSQDDLLVISRDYAFRFNLVGWGWIHLALGVVVLATGIALISGSQWARPVGVVLAGMSLLANFMWLPWYPVWAAIVITIDLIIIWALCCRTGVAPRA
ncbi:DUF7144 family membrane protein [Peterkaempfera griseoplana]|uniref:DUF7144 family membrane protein n=1 Tax=Peterkaempfera griseoplana TaxID=66896 RepID=UPI0006E30620|nr:hypothetical protein [Peterkaempfera griseoplana]